MRLHTTKTFSFGLIALMTLPLVSGYAQERAVVPVQSAALTAPPGKLSPEAVEVIRLAQSGVSEASVLDAINRTPAPFNLSAEEMLALKNAGLSPKVLAAMLRHDLSLRQPAETLAKPQLLEASYAQGYVAFVAATNAAPAPAVVPVRTNAPVAAPAPTTPAPAVRGIKRQPLVVVEQTPPAPLGEVVPLPPEPEKDYAWIPGHWAYRGGAWVWIGGEWKQRPGPGFVWVGGHWAQHGRGWTWVPGYWR